MFTSEIKKYELDKEVLNIGIWGTGLFGNYIFQQLKRRQDIKVVAFIDSNPLLWGSEKEGIKIVSPKVLGEDNEIDLVLVSFIKSIKFIDNMRQYPNTRIGIVKNSVFEASLKLENNLFKDKNIFWVHHYNNEKPILYSLETNIVDDCNLNCRGCSHFSNLFKRGDKVSFEEFANDLKKLAENTYIYSFFLLGGEALLNPKIIDYIELSRALLPETEIELISNGLLIPQQKQEFFDCCRDNDIVISISGYEPSLKIKSNIIKVLEKNNVKYSFRKIVKDFGKNIDLSGQNDPKTAMDSCRESDCHFFRKGRLYKCPFEALGNRFFTYFNLDIKLEGGIDIYSKEINWSREVKKINENPVDSCKYCGKEERISWCVANDPGIEDWII